MGTDKNKLKEAIEEMKWQSKGAILREDLVEDTIVSIKFRSKDSEVVKAGGGGRGKRFLLGLAAAVIIAAGVFGLIIIRPNVNRQEGLSYDSYADMMTFSVFRRLYYERGIEALEKHLEKASQMQRLRLSLAQLFTTKTDKARPRK